MKTEQLALFLISPDSTVVEAINAKIKELTDWKQQYTFEQGIAETIAWIRQHMDAYKTDIYNV